MNPLAKSIYSEFPRKVAPKNAEKAILKALKEIQKEDSLSLIEAHQWLLGRVKEYAERTARSGKEKQFIPHPATWINGGRYYDDPEEWGSLGNISTPNEIPDESRAREVWAEVIQEEYRMPFPDNWAKDWHNLPSSIKSELLQAL
jgi:hypothetical protein